MTSILFLFSIETNGQQLFVLIYLFLVFGFYCGGCIVKISFKFNLNLDDFFLLKVKKGFVKLYLMKINWCVVVKSEVEVKLNQ